jgi:hypothetical protein
MLRDSHERCIDVTEVQVGKGRVDLGCTSEQRPGKECNLVSTCAESVEEQAS